MAENTKNLDMNFMLTEYDSINNKISQHFDSAEKSFRIYVIIIGAALSFLGILYQTENFELVVFSLNKYQLLPISVIFIFGVIIFFKVIEHRLLITTYVRSLNLNKKWFTNRSSTDLKEYIFFDIGGHSPNYFSPLNHNFWEAIGLSFLNAVLGSIFLINVLVLSINQSSNHSFGINVFVTILLAILLVILQMSYYYLRAENLDRLNKKRLSSRSLETIQSSVNTERNG